MRHSWTKPSLSRDFIVLSAAILFLLCLVSAIVTYNTYMRNTLRVTSELNAESQHIEELINTEMDNANYLLAALGKQIALDDRHDLTRMARLLKTFDNRDYIYTIFTWVNPDHEMVISSDQGVRESPIDMSDRDYVQESAPEPWKMVVGRPVEGRASKRWVIPAAMGITDDTGKFLGTLVISIDIDTLSKRISRLVQHEGSSFAIASKQLAPLTQVPTDKDFIAQHFPAEALVNINFSQHPSGLVSEPSPWFESSDYAYYRVLQHYPFVILLDYDSKYNNEPVRSLLWSRLLQMAGLALFFVLFMWMVRIRLIAPVLDMTQKVSDIAGGKPYEPAGEDAPIEIEALSAQIRRVSDYIEENKRIESELRHKMFQMKGAKLAIQAQARSALEFMAYVCQEMHTPLNNLIGAAQVMKDQLYGPLENRKYRQYAGDMFVTGNELLSTIQELQTLARAETGAIALEEKPLDIEQAVGKAVRATADKMQTKNQTIKLDVQEPQPSLMADAFRLQQILMNLLLYAVENTKAGVTLRLEGRIVSEKRERKFYAFIVSEDSTPLLTETELLDMAQVESPIPESEQSNIGIALAKSLAHAHQGTLAVKIKPALTLAVFIGGARIHFTDEA